MARQRFIWPSLWEDPDLGRLPPLAQLLYIGCFSNADDEGRLLGDPTFLKTQIFRYRAVSSENVRRTRDLLKNTCSNFHVYRVHNIDYIAFLNWGKFQKPKYPSASKLPPPVDVPEAIPGIVPGDVPGVIPQRVGLGLGLPLNPHNRDKRKRRADLNDAAQKFAHDWKGGPSDAFDEGLDELEQLTGAKLQAGDRYRLWDQASHQGQMH